MELENIEKVLDTIITEIIDEQNEIFIDSASFSDDDILVIDNTKKSNLKKVKEVEDEK